jgi:hypothetical protein
MHRVSAAAIGGLLIVFALMGLTRGLALLSTHGSWVMGLSSNGLLSILSLVVGFVLVGAAFHSGPMASSASIVVGLLFVLSGLVNTLTVGTEMNVLAFRLPNIVFSFVVGVLLLIVGCYGRICGGLPMDSPYRHPLRETSGDVLAPVMELPGLRLLTRAATEQLAEAERAAALHYATPEQLRRLAVVHLHRSAEDRRRAWVFSE